jgi:hypothetical protein
MHRSIVTTRLGYLKKKKHETTTQMDVQAHSQRNLYTCRAEARRQGKDNLFPNQWMKICCFRPTSHRPHTATPLLLLHQFTNQWRKHRNLLLHDPIGGPVAQVLKVAGPSLYNKEKVKRPDTCCNAVSRRV